MENSVSPETDKQDLNAPTTYEAVLAQIVTGMLRSESEFTRRVAIHVDAIASQHVSWANQCLAGHAYDDQLCGDFESAFLLALSWLQAGGH